jgi:hypothetical protein
MKRQETGEPGDQYIRKATAAELAADPNSCAVFYFIDVQFSYSTKMSY